MIRAEDGHEMCLRFSQHTYQILSIITSQTGKTIPQILSDGIALQQMIYGAQGRRPRLLIECEGKYEELLTDC